MFWFVMYDHPQNVDFCPKYRGILAKSAFAGGHFAGGFKRAICKRAPGYPMKYYFFLTDIYEIG